MNHRLKSAICVIVPMALLVSTSAAQSPSANEQDFFAAIRGGDSAKIASLLKEHPAFAKAHTKNGITPILYAVYAKHPEIAEFLIAGGGELNIFEAAATGRIDKVRESLRKDPSLIRAFSPDGWTALHLNFNNQALAKMLIDAGADLDANSRNKLNATPLQGAAANNWIDLAKLYLSRGANVNCRSEGGGTPLHEAAANGFIDFAQMLVERGASVNARDDNGKTPLAMALEYKRAGAASFLRAHGAVE